MKIERDRDKPYHYPGYDGLVGSLSTTELILFMIACILCAGVLVVMPDVPL